MLTVSPQRLLSGVDRTVRVPGKTILSLTLTANTPFVVGLQVATTGLGNRLPTLGNAFEEFRFTEMVLKLHPSSTSTSYICGYFKDTPGNLSVTALADIYQTTASRLMGINETVPQTMILGRDVLLNGLRKWYDTDTSSGNPEDYSQGILVFISTAAPVFLVEIGYMIEFRGTTNPTTD